MTRSKITCRARSLANLTLAAVLTAAVTLPATTALAQDRDAQSSGERAKATDERPVEPTKIQIVGPVSIENKKLPHAITDWREGEPIPAGYHPAERTRRGPIIAGAVVFGILYVISVLVAGVDQDVSGGKSGAWLYAPVIGPFATIPESSSSTGTSFLVLDGVGQAAGAVLLVWGISSPQTVLVRDDQLGVRIAPRPLLLGKSGGGFGFVGSF